MSPKTGKQFEITNKNWFSGLKAGETLELAFQMTYEGNKEPTVVGAVLDGVDFCHGQTTTEVTPTNEISTTSSSVTESTTSSSTSCSAERYDYGEVLRLSNLFYEAQRSGDLPDNNRVPWRGDSSTDDKGNNGEDLSGGYHDGIYLFDNLTMVESFTIFSW